MIETRRLKNVIFIQKTALTLNVFFTTFLQTYSEAHSGPCQISNPVGIYLLKVNNRNTRTRCEICSKLTIKTPERRHNFKHVNADWEILSRAQ